jgi:hypothetical protein
MDEYFNTNRCGICAFDDNLFFMRTYPVLYLMELWTISCPRVMYLFRIYESNSHICKALIKDPKICSKEGYMYL